MPSSHTDTDTVSKAVPSLQDSSVSYILIVDCTIITIWTTIRRPAILVGRISGRLTFVQACELCLHSIYVLFIGGIENLSRHLAPFLLHGGSSNVMLLVRFPKSNWETVGAYELSWDGASMQSLALTAQILGLMCNTEVLIVQSATLKSDASLYSSSSIFLSVKVFASLFCDSDASPMRQSVWQSDLTDLTWSSKCRPSVHTHGNPQGKARGPADFKDLILMSKWRVSHRPSMGEV